MKRLVASVLLVAAWASLGLAVAALLVEVWTGGSFSVAARLVFSGMVVGAVLLVGAAALRGWSS